MEELLELKEQIVKGDLIAALAIVDELETISRQDKINTLESFLVVLLVHLIKIQVEQRVTRSWRNSIINSVTQIQIRNRSGKKSNYIYEWDEHYQNKLFTAIRQAAEEVFDGIEIEELESQIDYSQLQKDAKKLLTITYSQTEREIVNFIRDKYIIS
ncbi:MAG TPA: DUF29 family protein [Coleofasciculaceae cyanobacterium]|jgi:hypothetical protein